jgi:asparagine synthase (glutamine-hydrolysing)
MCGIYAYIGEQIKLTKYKNLKYRGPDDSSETYGQFKHISRMNEINGLNEINGMNEDFKDFFLAFYRLAVNGVKNGMQPFVMQGVYLICNGEIYNHVSIASKYNYILKTDSDCEVILHSYLDRGIEKTTSMLDGEFAFVIVDTRTNLVHFARDHMGVKPLYVALTQHQDKILTLELSSEIKGMANGVNAHHVLPRTTNTYDFNTKTLSISPYVNHVICNDQEFDLYELLRDAVIKRITNSEREVGFFLSGGLDSSLVLSIALDYWHECKVLEQKNTPIVHVFTFGFDENAPDVKSAKIMVDYFRKKYGESCIEWHLVIQSIAEGLKALPSVIYTLETYDTTTIRASTPMYLLSRYISQNTQVKVLLSGEGSDELFGGYLYFNYAPNDNAFRSEIIKLLNNIYIYDGLRAERTTAAHGLEIRPPFLDQKLVTAVLASDKLVKGKITKQLLRDIVASKNLLPLDILYGKKEAFSDAVGLSWKDELGKYTKRFIEEHIVDDVKYCKHIPKENAEMQYYQTVFYELFGPNYEILPMLWLPNQQWVKTGVEPSARVLTCYDSEIKVSDLVS